MQLMQREDAKSNSNERNVINFTQNTITLEWLTQDALP